MKFKIDFSDIKKGVGVFIGALIYAFGMNVFIVPRGLYSSGLLGFAQIIRTLIENNTSYTFGFDISGIISFVLNIPLMFLAYKTVGKAFIFKTAFCVAIQAILLSIIPIDEVIADPLTSTIIGGILCGFGIGLTLRNGGSSGGVDIIGMYYSKKSSYSVGAVSLFVNVFVYGFAFIMMQDIEKIIYALIFAGISTIALDKMHIQNINSEVLIFSKQHDSAIQNALLKEMRRGASYWEGFGAYTGEPNRVLYIVVSKYELGRLKKIVKSIDPNAFVAIKSGIEVEGNFEKRL